MTAHALPEVTKAVSRAGRADHPLLDALPQPPMVELAERIARLSGIPDARVFFTTSGTEANDTALLLATAYRRSATRSWRCATATTAGRSPRSASPATGAGHRPPSRRSRRCTCTAASAPAARTRTWRTPSSSTPASADLEDLLGQAGGDVAALIAEPIQGVGGFTPRPTGCSPPSARCSTGTASCGSADEVQTGWGRTGDHFWGWQAHAQGGPPRTSSPSPRASATACPSAVSSPAPRS